MSAYSDAVVRDGATAYWRLGESSGTTASDSIGSAQDDDTRKTSEWVNELDIPAIIEYDAETGLFRWRNPTYKHRRDWFPGELKRWKNTSYYYIVFSEKGRQRRRLYAHWVAWYLMTGNWPTKEIDHVDRDGQNNKWLNLREVTSQQNKFNKSVRYNSTTGVTGVCWDDGRNRWKAKITVNGKDIQLGRFHTIEEAIQIRREAELKYFGKYAPDVDQS